MAFEDLLYEERDGAATITINRPKVLNAFRAETVEEMIEAMRNAESDPEVGVIVLAGAGDRAFCAGGDNSARASTAESAGGYGGRGLVGLPIEELHSAIRDSRKPVIAKVQGYAIGGGNVLATVCDLTIASDKAVFGQVGPRVGSVDPGWGTAYSRAWSVRSGPARSGFCAAATPPPKRSRWDSSTKWCRQTSSTPRSRRGARRSWR